MAIDFPASPTNGQTFTSGALVYTYDGTKWTAQPAGVTGGTKIEVGNTKAEIVDTGSDGTFAVTTEGTQRLSVTTTAVSSTLAVDHPLGAVGTPSITFTGDLNTGLWSPTADTLAASTAGAERLRVNSSGQVGIGTTTGSILSKVDVLAGTGGTIHEALCLVGGTNIVAGSGVRLRFSGNPENRFVRSAYIETEMTGTNAHNLKFATNAAGVEPVERMRIEADGAILLRREGYDANAGISASGIYLNAATSGSAGFTRTSAAPIWINRLSTDGTLVDFAQDTTVEGSISVSGTTVTYGGGHLARWSQLPNDEDPSALLKGTVMSNLDEMCEWGEEDNEQLNKTKVSDVEGDPNVAGVFVATSFSDDGPLDFFCAMTGDMIIRIAEGVTVQRGDLLMSAGDGTAKPQDDDIIRSKTVAKVTSTHVTCTYDDGSYCVPCVLMAC
jgi:hypothetical protein